MSALSTPGGGGTTAQSKPASGKQKYQKLDINSLYCANRNENSEPSSVKSQLSRKHGMQSLGKVPSARRPPANLPSLKTETGQDPNSNSISATTTTTVSPPATCTSQTITTSSSSGVVAGTGPGGWVPLPPPSSPHFRTEFPSLEAAAQPSHRSSEHSANQPQLRPQTEGSWTCGGGVAVRGESSTCPATAPASSPASQQTPAFRAILPSFLMKGSSGGGLGLGTLGNMREARGGGVGSGSGGGGSASATSVASRGAPRPPATPRAVEVLTARPILREEQISSLDDISRDAGWAQHDDIDYDQKLDFSDGESSAPSKASSKNNNRASIEHERIDSKILEPGDEDQMWAERRQKQNNEVAQAVARARQRKEEEQRRQMRDAAPAMHKDSRERADRGERDRNDNRDREPDTRDKDRMDRDRERPDNRDRERLDNRDKDRERSDPRDKDQRDKERLDTRDRERFDNRDRDVRDRDRDVRDRDRERDRIESRDRGRMDNRDRQENEKDRMDARDRDRNDRDRDRFDRERDRVDRDRNDRDRDFRDRDRDYGRDRDQNNPAFSKTFQANIPPRFLKQQQNRQQEDQHKAWAFPGKPTPRRQEPPSYNAPRHTPHNGGRRSYSRDYSDREDDFRRDKEGPGPQWRSEMQEYERPARELDRSNSKDSYKDYGDYKDRRNDSDRKSSESTVEHTSSRTAADKLTEVFERKSIGLTEPFASSDSSIQTQAPERRNSPPSNVSQRESSERDFGKTSWADVTQDEPINYTILKSTQDKLPAKDSEQMKDSNQTEVESEDKRISQLPISLQQTSTLSDALPPQNQPLKTAQISQMNTHTVPLQNITSINQSHSTVSDSQTVPKTTNLPLSKSLNQTENISTSQIQKQPSSENIPPSIKPTFTSQKSEKELSESESIASKSSTDPSSLVGIKVNETHSVESLQVGADSQKRPDDKRHERFSNEQLGRISGKEPIERKSSGSGSEKKGRGYGGGYSVYVRGWGPRESRGRRSHRSSRSKNRASESDGSTDGAPNMERKERRRAPRSPRGPKKQGPDDGNRLTQHDQAPMATDGMENREPFAPRGQPSRRGRGGFQGTSRPPAPAKRVTGYGPPNTKSPFSQANRAVKENDDVKDNALGDDKGKMLNKTRTASSGGRGRDRRPKGTGGPLSGEDENWETTSEHSEGGGTIGRRRSVGGRQLGQSQKTQGGRNQNSNNRQNNARNSQGAKRDAGDNKTGDVTEAMNDLKLSTVKKDEEPVDDGFQEVRNKKNSKDARGPSKEENPHAQKQQRSHSNQGGRNGSSSRNPSEKSNPRGSAPVPGKSSGGPQYDRPRQANLAPRFVKQRQKQMGLVTGFGPDTGAAPPPPAVNAWDKPISQTLRGNVEEPAEVPENKSGQSSQRSTPGDAPIETKTAPCAIATDKTGVLDGTTPPVETIIFENTNYKTAPPAEALKQKHQPGANTTAKPPTPGEEIPPEVEARPLPFNGDVRPRPRSIQELIGDNGRPTPDGEAPLGLPISFDTSQKAEDSSDMKLDFAFDSDLGQLTEDKSAKTLGLPRGTHMSTSNAISPLAADLNLKIASVKKVWEMPAVAEGAEELQFAGFEESNTETGAAPNVCKVKPTQQLQSPPPQHYNHVGYQGGYGGLSAVPSPPAVPFISSQQLLGNSQQLQQQGGLYGAFLDQSRGQFGGFPGTPYGAGSAAPYNYQPPPDMFQSLPNQYRIAAAAGGGAAFGQSGQLGNSPSTVLISSSTNSLMSATVKPSTQQIGAIGSKGGGVGGVGGVNTYQQQYLGYSGPVGEAPYSLQGLLPRPAPPAPSSYYSPYQPQAAPAPTYPLQFTSPGQSGAFGSQFLSSQLQVAAAVQQMQQQYRAPMQQQYAPPQPRPPPAQQMKSPLHEHANGFAPLCEAASPTPKGANKPQKPPHSPPQHKYHAPPQPPPAAQQQPHHHPHHAQHQQHAQHPQHQQHQQHHHHQQHTQQMMGGGNNGRSGGNGGGSGVARGGMMTPRYPAPIQRPHAPALPLYRAPPAPQQQPQRPHAHPVQQPPRQNVYYQHHQRNGAGGAERAAESVDVVAPVEEPVEVAAAAEVPPAAEVKAE